MTSAESRIESQTTVASPWRDAFRGVRAAFATLTRIPIGGFPYSAAEWRWSSAHLPFVGACIGALLAMVWLCVSRAGYGVAAILTTATSLLLTGAMHEDGLADTADGLGGGLGDRERILRIMKDSRVGTYGAAAITLSLGLRVALLIRLGPLVPAALVMAECGSRVVPVWLMARLPYVTDPTVQKSAAITRAGSAQLAAAAAWVVVIATPCAWRLAPSLWSGVVLVGPIVLTSWGLSALFRARLGGITGDTLGAAEQLTWIGLLVAFVLLLGGPP